MNPAVQPAVKLPKRYEKMRQEKNEKKKEHNEANKKKLLPPAKNGAGFFAHLLPKHKKMSNMSLKLLEAW